MARFQFWLKQNVFVYFTVTTRLRHVTAYADHILVMARAKQTLIDTFVKLKEEAKRRWLVVNEGKTKYMKCGERKTNENKLQIKTMKFEKVQSFKYPE
jgi:ABC-type sugar transport system ATPase subunit